MWERMYGKSIFFLFLYICIYSSNKILLSGDLDYRKDGWKVLVMEEKNWVRTFFVVLKCFFRPFFGLFSSVTHARGFVWRVFSSLLYVILFLFNIEGLYTFLIEL